MTAPSSRPLTIQDFDSVDWQVVEASGGGNLQTLANQFYDLAAQALAEGNQGGHRALTVLGHVCSFRLSLDDGEHPFRPSLVSETFGSATPDDVGIDEVEVLRGLIPRVQDLKLKAQLADFVWVRRRGHVAAGEAVSSYLGLAQDLIVDEASWPPPLHYLERALQLSVQLGDSTEPYNQASRLIQRVLDQRSQSETGLLSRNVFTLARKYGIGDPVAHHALAAAHAERAESRSDWGQAEQYWLAAEDAAVDARDDERRREALRRVSETYVARAREAEGRPYIGKLQAATHLQHAIEALRRAGGMRPRADELHAMMMDYQQGIPGALPSFTYQIPIGEAVSAAQAAVGGKQWEDALVAFALLPRIPKEAELQLQAEEGASKYLLKALFPAVQHNREGKVIARQGSLNASDPEEHRAALRVDMIQAAIHHYHISGQAVVRPARAQMIRDHPIRVESFTNIVVNNPLVMVGHEALYAEAFYAGFVGDMPKALSLVVHLIEQSIRGLLARAGVRVTILDGYGMQLERDLNTLLYEPRLKELLGEDLVFSLQALLVEKFGLDLRNQISHGLVTYNEFFSPHALYTWWLCLRVICLPVLREGVDGLSERPDPPAGEG